MTTPELQLVEPGAKQSLWQSGSGVPPAFIPASPASAPLPPVVGYELEALGGRPDRLPLAGGQIVEAHVVLMAGVLPDEATIKRLQDHVKAMIAPYKYPRSVRFLDALPKTATGKIQRFRLREN